MARVAAYIDQLLAMEEYSFSLDELREAVPASELALTRELSRLVGKREIFKLRNRFYLILPPRYRTIGHLPIELYIGKLLGQLNKQYYIGLFSAARMHGASHQQIQSEYVIVSRPGIANIEKKGTSLKFFSTVIWPERNIMQRKADAGIYNISSPGLTALDLINYQTKIGGLGRSITVLEELSEEIGINEIYDLLTWYPYTSNMQRLGYVLETVRPNFEGINVIYEYLKKQPFYPVFLTPDSEQKPGAVENRWKVVVNIEIESDL